MDEEELAKFTNEQQMIKAEIGEDLVDVDVDENKKLILDED